jgi:hypothetical protein
MFIGEIEETSLVTVDILKRLCVGFDYLVGTQSTCASLMINQGNRWTASRL